MLHFKRVYSAKLTVAALVRPWPKQFRPPVKRRVLVAIWEASRAAASGVSLDAYLQYRFARYLAVAPQHGTGVTPLSIDGAELSFDGTVLPVPYVDRSTFEAASVARGVATALETVRSGAKSRAGLLSAKIVTLTSALSVLDLELKAAEKKVAAENQSIADGIRSGVLLGIPSAKRRTVQYRWPSTEGRWLLIGIDFATGCGLLAEAYAFGMAYADTVGVDITDLPGSWQRAPQNVVMGALFALSASGVLFLAAHLGIQIVRKMTMRISAGRRAFVLASLAAGLLCWVALTGTGIAAMRFLLAEAILGKKAQADPTGMFVGTVSWLLTLGMPLVLALMQESVFEVRGGRDASNVKRRECREAAEKKIAALEKSRSSLEHAQALRNEVAKKREVTSSKLSDFQAELAKIKETADRECVELEGVLRELLAAENRYVTAFWNSVRAALQTDRIWFQRVTNRGQLVRVLRDGARTFVTPRFSPQGAARSRSDSAETA